MTFRYGVGELQIQVSKIELKTFSFFKKSLALAISYMLRLEYRLRA